MLALRHARQRPAGLSRRDPLKRGEPPLVEVKHLVAILEGR
jgi:hypothetical protein